MDAILFMYVILMTSLDISIIFQLRIENIIPVEIIQMNGNGIIEFYRN